MPADPPTLRAPIDAAGPAPDDDVSRGRPRPDGARATGADPPAGGRDGTVRAHALVLLAVLVSTVSFAHLGYQHVRQEAVDAELSRLGARSRLLADRLASRIAEVRREAAFLSGLPSVQALVRGHAKPEGAGPVRERVAETFRGRLRSEPALLRAEIVASAGGRPLLRVESPDRARRLASRGGRPAPDARPAPVAPGSVRVEVAARDLAGAGAGRPARVPVVTASAPAGTPDGEVRGQVHVHLDLSPTLADFESGTRGDVRTFVLGPDGVLLHPAPGTGAERLGRWIAALRDEDLVSGVAAARRAPGPDGESSVLGLERVPIDAGAPDRFLTVALARPAGSALAANVAPARSRNMVVLGGAFVAALAPALLLSLWFLRRAERENARYRAVMNSALDPIVTTDLHGTVLSASRSVEEVFQWAPEELVGRNVSVLVPEPHRSRHDGYLEAYRRTGRSRLLGATRELDAVRRDGSLFPCELSVTRVDLPTGPPLLCGMIRDVTRRRAAEGELAEAAAELRARNAELERSNRDLDDFAYIASHDLKEPLRGIHNFSRILLEDHGSHLDADGHARLGTLVRLSQRLETLIDDLLYYSRAGRTELATAPTSLQEVVEDVLERLGERLRENHASVRILGELPTVVCDRVRVGEIFQNLVANALKYNVSPSKRIEIGVLEPRADERAGAEPAANGAPADDEKPEAAGVPVLFVRDNGIGMREQHLGTVFRMFKRLHARDRYGGGNGVGLTISKKLVEKHGGRIWVESTFGVGSTFFFTLGRAEEAPHAAENSTPDVPA